MAKEPSVTELAIRWQELRDQGQIISAAELCADCPQLREELEHRIQAMLWMSQVQGGNLASPATIPGQESQVGEDQSSIQTTQDLTSPAAPASASQFPFLRPAEQPDELGRLAHYRILALLGKGGMGIVFRAEDLLLHRLVALKVIRPDMVRERSARDRFLREARTAASVEHECIVPILHVGQDNSVLFLVMPLLRGESLEERLRREPRLEPNLVLAIGRQVAEGLTAAHALGLVHRDIKPANLWLETAATPPCAAAPTETPPVRGVKILDFGLARNLANDRLTRSGVVLGTPAYMAPEQAEGREVDSRADLFSLGVTLYRMCTGSNPFEKGDVLATLSAAALDEPEPAMKVNPSVPAALSDLIMQLLAKEPEKRPASAALLSQTLTKLEQGASTDPEATSAVRKRQRKRVLLGLAAGLLALLAGGIVIIRNHKGEKIAEIDLPDGATVEVIPGKTAESKKPANPDLDVAKWVLSRTHPGRLGISLVGEEDKAPVLIKDPGELPGKDFRVRYISFLHDKDVADKDLKRLRPLTKLETLILDLTNITDEGIAHLRGMSSLRLLDLAGTKISDAGLAHLKTLQGLQDLWLGLTAITDSGLKHLDGLSSLKGLNLVKTAITDKGLDHLKELLQLEALNLNFTRVSIDGVQKLHSLRRLRELHIAVTGIQGPQLGVFSGWDNLRLLGIDGDQAGGIEQLSSAKQLSGLFLHGGNITEDTLVKTVKQLPDLTYLELSWTGIPDEGLKHLKGLKRLNGVGLHGFYGDASLEQLKELKGLQVVRFIYTHITDEGARRLKDELPRAEIIISDPRGFRIIAPEDPKSSPPWGELRYRWCLAWQPEPTPAKDQVRANLPQEEWQQRVAKLPTEGQIAALSRRLQHFNPGFNGQLQLSRRPDGSVLGLELPPGEVAGLPILSRLPAFASLQEVKLQGDANKSQLTNLNCLRGLRLEVAHLNDHRSLSDLSPLQGMPLRILAINVTGVSNLSPLKGSPLQELWTWGSRITDLNQVKSFSLQRLGGGGNELSDFSPLKGMQLIELNVADCRVSDLEPLRGMTTLRTLRCGGTQLKSLVPLEGMELDRLSIEHNPDLQDFSSLQRINVKSVYASFVFPRDLPSLKAATSLKDINWKPAAEFWKQVNDQSPDKKP